MIPWLFTGILICMALQVLSQGFSYVKIKHHHKRVSFNFCLFSINAAVILLSTAFLSLVSYPIIQNILHSIKWFSLISICALFIQVLAEITREQSKRDSLIISCIIYIGVVFFVIDVFAKTITIVDSPWGYSPQYNSIFPKFVILVIAVLTCSEINIVMSKFRKKCKRKRELIVYKLLVHAILSMLSFTVIQLIYVFRGIPVFPWISISLIVTTGFMKYASTQYDSLEIYLDDYDEFLSSTKSEPVCICNDEGVIVFINKCAEIETIEEKESIIGKSLFDIFIISPTDQEEILKPHKGAQVFTVIYKASANSCNLTIQNVYDQYGDIFSFVVTVYKIKQNSYFEESPMIISGQSGNHEKADSDEERDAVMITKEAEVLLVDNRPIYLTNLEKMMDPYHMNITKAYSGAEALSIIHDKHFDIIFVEHQMPEMNGITLAKKIRELDGNYYVRVPIIFCTDRKIEECLNDFLKVRFNDYLQRPILENSLSDVLTRWLWSRVSVEDEEQQKQSIQTEESEKKLAESGPYMKIDIDEIDDQAVSQYIGSNVDIYEQLLEVYESDMGELLKELKANYSNYDFESLRIKLHTVIRASEKIGVSSLIEHAENLIRISDSDDLAQIDERYQTFVSRMESLLEKIGVYLQNSEKNENRIRT